ncbi:phosphatidylglycerol lysyltransferase domain-containing protein [Flavihumibacter petaseus]|uniref:Phosphatidylglycerol lysyltransferase n=1 Tax=Flavihumibacter petaseus NBRC 106054 TaxID=1220578 RepID=A0A0E9MV65_9BACT|nr:phosphatidylglycerol lysyltransferase domain-containing protein [Flavihumibacter petaseus]GAO41647.1 hypothetical protein FPE01S_01_06610 [Flavihumibacter petaseus NBRC 106054]
MATKKNWKEILSGFAGKLHWKELLAILFILLGIYFFRHERHELKALQPYLKSADNSWMLFGLAVTGIYIFFQAALFVFSFQAVGSNLSWPAAFMLFLKRNFISTFLPGGGITAFAYLPGMLRKEKIDRHHIYQGAGLQGFIGILSLVIVGIPVILYGALHRQSVKGAWPALAVALLILFMIWRAFQSFRSRGWLYQSLLRFFPALEKEMENIFSLSFSYRSFTVAVLSSIAIEMTGVLHIVIAMKAGYLPVSLEAAFMGYVVSTLFMLISPFLKGLGAVELSLTFILKQYGYDTLAALQITLLYRLFEFWLPLFAGLLSWAWKGRNIFVRLLPPALIFLLGAVNIFSVLTPPLADRMHLLHGYLPYTYIHASNWLVILTGLLLMVNAAFLIRGLRAAWWFALFFSVLSLVGHLTKALDYEEALLALTIIVVLLTTRKQYRQKSNARFIRIGVITALAVFGIVLIFGTIGFYQLDRRNFGIDFSWRQSFTYALHQFLLVKEDNLVPVTRFGKEFLISLRVLASGAWIFLFYTIIRPYVVKHSTDETDQEKVSFLLSQYGNSPVDYFKSDEDKLWYFPEGLDAFVAYKIANGFAIVLEEPVAAPAEKLPALLAFEQQCRSWGLKPAYYRIDEDAWYYFEHLKKKKLLIGQEAILDLTQFTLEGKQNKSLRNGLNSLQKKGYSVALIKAPLEDTLLSELKAVSDEWLEAFNKSEMRFSQGVFDPEVIREQDVVTLRDADGRLVAFLNIIPDFAPEECTYDLIRKTVDAPGGSMDALLVEMIRYGKEEGFSFLNLGLVPMSGIEEPDSTAERVVKYAYEKIKRFRHYQGLREFKEKYAGTWENKYLVYENDFDLLQLPVALNKVMQG